MRQVLPIAGAIVGAYFGNPQLGFAIGSLIGNAVDPVEIQGSKVGDNPLQTAAEGGARAIVFGTGCVRATCLLERGNRQVVEVEDQAGKGGPVTVNERVYWTFAIGLGEAIPGGAIIRIWEGEKLVYDASPESAIPAETAEFACKFRFYDGSETQLPDPALEAIHGIGNAHYYRGTAYVVFPNYDLTDYREQIPVYRWEVAAAAESTLLSAMATMRISGSPRYLTSPDGTDWSGPVHTIPGGDLSPAAGVLPTGQSFLVYETPFNNVMRYNDGSWETASGDGLTGIAGRRIGWSDSVTAAIATGNGIAVSSTDGTSFNRNAAGAKGECVFKVGEKWVALRYSTNELFHGTDPSALSSVISPGPSLNPRGVFANEAEAYVVGDTAGNAARVVRITPSPSFQTVSVPFAGGELPVRVASDGNGGWLIATNAGGCYQQTTDGDWEAINSFGHPVSGLTFNGANYIGFGSSSGTGYIRELVSGTWVTRRTVDLASPNSFSFDIAAQPMTGNVIGGKVTLASILTALHLRAGHMANDFDVSECTEMVTGVVFESSVTFAEAINSVIGSYFKDPTEYDRKIRYIGRGKAVVRTLTEDDLVDEPETSRRENAIEYPRKLHYFFQSPITHYAATKATSARSSPDVHVIGEVSVSSPITYDNPDEPARVSAKLHKVYWADAEGEIVWHVTDEHADLVPGDCVGLNLRGVVRRARITSIEDDPGVRKLTMRIDRQSAYTSNVTGIPLPPPTPPRPSIIAPSIGLTMDIPALTDDADDLHYLRAIFGITDVWAGAVDQRSLDGGASFASINTASRAAIVGTLQADVAAASPHCTDTTNRVVLQLYVDRVIDSISDAQFLREGGAFALSYMDGGVRKWEICQYRDAEQDGDGNWILTTLHRGLLNTTAAAHSSGDYFVLLGRGLLKNSAQTAWIGQEMVHRAVSNGLSPETAATETMTYTGQSQTEWPVASVGLELDGGILSIDIVPRHRFGTDAHPVRSLNWTGYRVMATDGANSETYETLNDSSGISVSGWSGPITVSVAQINRITGAGPTVSESIAA